MDSFKVRSHTKPDVYYTVRIDGDEADCDCPSTNYGKTCKHIRMARELMTEEEKWRNQT